MDSLRRGTPVGGPPCPGSGPISPPPFLSGMLVLPNECSRSCTPLMGVPMVKSRFPREIARIADGVAIGVADIGVDAAVDDVDGPASGG